MYVSYVMPAWEVYKSPSPRTKWLLIWHTRHHTTYINIYIYIYIALLIVNIVSQKNRIE